MKTLSGRMGGRIDLIAVRRVRQELGGVVTQLPVRWYESAEGAVLLRTYALLCAVEAYLTAEETKIVLYSGQAEADIDKFLDGVCPVEVMEQSAAEARAVYAGLRRGALSPACVVGAAYKPLYDEGYVYTGMNAEVLSAMKGHYETISSVIAPVQDTGEGALLFPKGESGTALLAAVKGLFRLYAGAADTAIEPAQDAKTSKYRLFTVSDHGGKSLSGMLRVSIRALFRTKEV